ncbi:hypothetical protein ASPWEDRAFT_438632 [Aspergillus wentii DTO 134E9]|uniref:Uncharacterized protein n=1 Tax=Aspergillus wentii DTO 134E9 TaxID=1073089 RepID=A0A1L9RQ74_ASPWE|nr:uncharacterized protein ASPWEDRAFT_438632 [Aspergillus wentii DTO 134E9]OJJ37079.1 hypothetical protein ASPWEDRAFT_438632 [Aspergillus wentii DTO 134E9]
MSVWIMKPEFPGFWYSRWSDVTEGRFERFRRLFKKLPLFMIRAFRAEMKVLAFSSAAFFLTAFESRDVAL